MPERAAQPITYRRHYWQDESGVQELTPIQAKRLRFRFSAERSEQFALTWDQRYRPLYPDNGPEPKPRGE